MTSLLNTGAGGLGIFHSACEIHMEPCKNSL